MQTLTNQGTLIAQLLSTRVLTETICQSLEADDFSVQPAVFVSPPKWHLGHTTWFFEQFVLSKYKEGYTVFHEDFCYYFNSYYNTVGDRVLRADRGHMTRPVVQEVLAYRSYVTKHLEDFMKEDLSQTILEVIEIGIHHEQQHQELLCYDIKYILGNQPAFPNLDLNMALKPNQDDGFETIDEGVYGIGHNDTSFCFDNELGYHNVYLHEFQISKHLVTNAEYMEFIDSGAYTNFSLWHADGWDWIQQHSITAPLYWRKVGEEWQNYTFKGLVTVNPNLPVTHISFYEAWAFAEWKGMRLPTEFEWEVASKYLNYGQLWEWTNSAYLPYPNFKKADGALGEYNGKFMVNQMVLRGGSIASPPNHVRPTYRNFFQPDMRWMFSGIRLTK